MVPIDRLLARELLPEVLEDGVRAALDHVARRARQGIHVGVQGLECPLQVCERRRELRDLIVGHVELGKLTVVRNRLGQALHLVELQIELNELSTILQHDWVLQKSWHQ